MIGLNLAAVHLTREKVGARVGHPGDAYMGCLEGG